MVRQMNLKLTKVIEYGVENNYTETNDEIAE